MRRYDAGSLRLEHHADAKQHRAIGFRQSQTLQQIAQLALPAPLVRPRHIGQRGHGQIGGQAFGDQALGDFRRGPACHVEEQRGFWISQATPIEVGRQHSLPRMPGHKAH